MTAKNHSKHSLSLLHIFILLSGSVERESVLLVYSQLSFYNLTIQFLRGPMTPFHNVRGFMFPSLKPRDLTPRMSLLSYQYRKGLIIWHLFFVAFRWCELKWKKRVLSIFWLFYFFGTFGLYQWKAGYSPSLFISHTGWLGWADTKETWITQTKPGWRVMESFWHVSLNKS